MTWDELSGQWFRLENPNRKHTHSALYSYIMVKWGDSGFKECFEFDKFRASHAVSLPLRMFEVAYREVVKWGFVTEFTNPRSMYETSLIKLNKIDSIKETEHKKNSRFYIDKSYEYILEEEKTLGITPPHRLESEAKRRHRMYAGIFCRDMAKKLINEKSVCAVCETSERLSVDHKTPISKGGLNTEDNAQILCRVCNSRKGNRE